MNAAFRMVMVLAMLFRLLFISPVPVYAASLTFSDWGAEIVDMAQYDSLDNAQVGGGAITAQDNSSSFTASYVVDVSSIAGAVNAGEANLRYSFTCGIVAEGEGEDDNGQVTLTFVGNGTTQSHSCGVENQGGVSNAFAIPGGTSAIRFTFTGTVQGTVNTVVFNGFSVVIDDLSAPRIALASVPDLEGGARVNVNIEEYASGLESAYYAAGDLSVSDFPAAGTILVVDGGSGSFDVSSGGIYTIYSRDVRGNAVVSKVDVNTYPEISDLFDQSLAEDGSLNFNFFVADQETADGDLVVEAQSMDQQLLVDENILITNTEGTVAVQLVPVENANGSTSVEFSVTDVGGLTRQQSISLEVTVVNDVPVANPDNVQTIEDTPLVIDVLSNDTNPDHGTLTVAVTIAPMHGDAEVNADGSITYSPDTNTNGEDTFTYQITDPVGGDVAEAAVTINIIAEDDAPHAVDDSYDVDEDGSLVFTVTGNDWDVEGDAFGILSHTQPSHASLELNTLTGEFTYIPTANYFGQDSFSYTIAQQSDPSLTSTALVTLTVKSINDAPEVTFDAAITTAEDTAISKLINATDVDQDVLNMFIKDGFNAAHGTVELTEDGYVYTPAADYYGEDAFTISVTDGTVEVDCEISVNVTAVNDAPRVTYEENISTDEDTAVSKPLTISDPDQDELSVTVKESGQPLHGTLQLNEGGYTYTPDGNYHGNDAFTITVSDGVNEVDCAVAVVVASVNDVPEVTYDTSILTNEDTAITRTVTVVDADLDPIVITIKEGGAPEHGNLSLEGDTYAYTPAENYYGEDAFTLLVSDGVADVECPVAVTVQAVNDAPTAVFNAVISTDEDTSITEGFSASDVDLDLLQIYVKEGNHPLHGAVELTEGGYTYTPAADYHGADTFHITVFDGTVEVDNTITVNVDPVNDAPTVAYSASIALDEDSPVIEGFVVVDIDQDAVQVYVKDGNHPAHGTLTLGEDAYTYSPDPDYNGADGFIISVSDGTVVLDKAITVSIAPVNDDPIPTYAASISTEEDTASNQSFTASDIDQDTLSFYVKDGNAPAHGSLTLSLDSYTYSPASNYQGTDEFIITVFDGTVEVDCAISVTITAVNDAPLPVYSSAVSTDEDVSLSESLTATDVDLDELSFFVKEGNHPQHGSLALVEGGYTYTPTADYNGSDSFTITVSDGTVEVDCPITVTVVAVNDAPVPTYTASISTSEDTAAVQSLTAEDVDQDALTFTVKPENQPQHGILDLYEGGYTYTPAQDYNGNDAFIITVSDGTVEVDCLIDVTVSAVNDCPIALDDIASTAEDTSVSIPVLNNDSDVDIPEGDQILPSAIIVQPSHGTVQISGAEIIYSPALNYFGSDIFTYQISDQNGLTAEASVSISVHAVNDAPQTVALDSEYTCPEDGGITISFDLIDVETPTETLTMQIVSQNVDVVPQNRITITGLEDVDPAVVVDITPLANQYGEVPFTVRVSDGFQTATYTFTLQVTAVNDAPNARNDSLGYIEDEPLVISQAQLMSNDSDIDNEQASLVFDGVINTTSHGTLGDNGDGILTYSPELNYRGSDSFTYQIHDPDGATDMATVFLTASGVNDAPTISEIGDQVIDEDSSISVPFSVADPDLLTDTELDTLMITSASSNPDLLDANNMRVIGSGANRTFTAMPLPDKNGQVTITITVSDGIEEVSEQFIITINPIPDAPVAEEDFFYVNDAGTTTIDPLANDWDADGDTVFTSTIVTNPTYGTLTPNGQRYDYTPLATFQDADSFTYYITDSTSRDSETVTVTLSADPSNHAPFISSIQNQAIFEDGSGMVNATVEDEDGNLELVEALSSNEALIPGTNLVLNNTGSAYSMQFTPLVDAHGVATLTLRATDARGNISSKSFRVQVIAVNDIPQAVDDIVETNEDASVVFNVLSNDVDIETPSENLILSRVLTFPTHGTLASVGNGQFRYTPYEDFNGSDSFGYEVLDADGGSSSATVDLTIHSVNDAPEAYSNYLETIVAPGSALDNINVIGNDTDPDLPYDPEEEIHVTRIVSQPACGTAFVNLDGTLKYEAFNGAADCSPAWIWFTYEIEDHYGAIDTASVSIPVDSDDANLPPRVVNVWRSMQEDGATITVDLANYAYDPDGDVLSFALPLSDPPHTSIGSAALEGSILSYTPDANKNADYGQENFTFSVSDGNATAEGTIYVRVAAVNDAPTISMGSSSIIPIPDQSIQEDANLALDFYIDDVDKGDTGTTFGIDDLSLGIYSDDFKLIPPESISYTRDDVTGLINLSVTPPANEAGDVNITVVVSDGITSTTDVFLLGVQPVNDAPIAGDHLLVTDEEIPGRVHVVDEGNDIDEGETLTITQEIAPTHGSLSFDQANGCIIYTPTLDYYGTDQFTYRITDSGELSDTGVVEVTVNNVNDAPVISNLAPVVETGEDIPIDVTFTVADVDNTLQELVLGAAFSEPSLISSYSFTKSEDGSGQVTLHLEPASNLSGEITIELSASDGDKIASADFDLLVYAINDPPIAQNDSRTIDEDHSITINVLENDTDIEDPTTLYVISNTNPLLVSSGTAGHGSVTNNNDGTLTYNPGTDQNEDVYFTYQVSDSGNLRTSATVYITINAVNDVPRVRNDSRTTAEDTPVAIGVLSNDSDVENDVFHIVSFTDPVHGSVELDEVTQTFTYTPELNYFGSDSFSYTVGEDLHTEMTASANVYITITASDDYPIVDTTEPWVMQEDTPQSFTVDISDAETASANLLITFTSLDTDLIKSHNVVLQGSGTSRTVHLTPQAEMNGTLQLKVEVNDGLLTTVELIDIVIEPVNDPPTAQDYVAETNEDVLVGGVVVVKGDIDLSHEGDSHTYYLHEDAPQGSASVMLDGTWTYAPDANFNGTDSFTVRVVDEGGLFAISAVEVAVYKVNDVPVVTSDNTHVIEEDTPALGTIVVYDPDTADSVDPDSCSMTVSTPATHGTVELDGLTGNYTYTPNLHYNGSDSFVVTVTDEHDATTSKTVSITIIPVNDAPLAEADTASVAEDHSVVIDVLANDTDIDLSREGDDLVIQSVDGVDNGNVMPAADGKSLTFTPSPNWFGVERFTYTVKDQNDATASAEVTVTVSAVNDAPSISDILDQEILEDTSTGALNFSVTDVDDDDASLNVTAATSNGIVLPLSAITFGGSDTNRTVTLTPTTNHNTWDRINLLHEPVLVTLTVSDGELSDSDTFTLTVLPDNDAPVAADDAKQMDEDHVVIINVLDNDSDVDQDHEGDSLSIVSVTGVDNAEVTIVSEGKSLQFDPHDDWFGEEIFTYIVEDEHGARDDALVTVTVDAVNDAPIISPLDDQIIDEDGSTIGLVFTLSDVDTNVEDLQITKISSNTQVVDLEGIQITGSGSERTLVISPIPDKNTWDAVQSANVPITIGIQVSDGSLTDITEFTLIVQPINDAPQANADSASTPEDHSVTISVLNNDTDVDLENEGDDLTITKVVGEQYGSVSIATNRKTITYTPQANWNGEEQLTYTIRDLSGETSDAVVVITVQPENDAPQAVDDTAATVEDTAVTISVLDNDTDVDLDMEGDDLLITSVSGVDNGQISIASDGKSLTFTPQDDWNGNEEFSYTVRDSHDATDTALVRVTVTGTIDDPQAVDDTYTLSEDCATAALNVLLNDEDADLPYGDELTLVDIIAAPQHGTASINMDTQRIEYKPDANYNGTDSLRYTIRDTQDPAVISSAQVNLTITPVNDIPVITSENQHIIQEDEQVLGNITVVDPDVDDTPDPDSHTFIVEAHPTHGMVTLDASTGEYTFTPEAHFHGYDSFTIRVTDEHSGSATRLVRITITSLNDAPQASDASYNTPENTPVVESITATDPDIATDNDALTYVVKPGFAPQHGTLDLDENTGEFSYTPADNYNGQDEFVVVVTDKAGASDEAHISIFINYYENDPVANADAFELDEDTMEFELDVMANDEDSDLPYGDELHLVGVVDGPTHGDVQMDAGGQVILYSPFPNYNGQDTFTYRIRDNQDPAVFATGEVTLTIHPVNDEPIVTSENSHELLEETSITDRILVEDVDLNDTPDPDSHTFRISLAPGSGTAVVDENTGEYTYTPEDDYNGTDAFTVVVTDERAAATTKIVTLNITAVADDPQAKPDSYKIKEDDGWRSMDVVANDEDADLPYGDVLLLTQILSDPSHGSVRINSDTNKVEYKPDANYHGSDAFTYEIRDDQDPWVTSSAEVRVLVEADNDAPAVGSSGYSHIIDEDTSASGRVIASDSDGDGLRFTLDPNDTPQHGTALVDAVSGEYTYTPFLNFNGMDSFTILVSDGSVTVRQTITITVLPVNDDPNVGGTQKIVSDGNPITMPIPVGDVDILTNGDRLTYTVVGTPGNGSVVLIPVTGEFTYTPDAGFVGTDTFTIRITDEHGASVEIVITVTVEGEAQAAIPGDQKSQPGSDGPGWGNFPIHPAWGLLAPFFLLPLLTYNVSISYYSLDENGKAKKHNKRKWVLLSKDGSITLDLRSTASGSGDEIEVLLLRSFVKKFKDKTLIFTRDGKTVKTVTIESNDDGRMRIKV